MTGSEIYAGGYRAYEGKRTGAATVVLTLMWSTVRSILGLGRSARHKVLPVIVMVLAFLPAIVFSGLALLFPIDLLGDEAGPKYWELVASTWLPALVFCSMVVPEALVRDRRNAMFSLSLTTSLTRGRYLLGKALAAVLPVAMVLAAPALLYLLGVSAEGSGPGRPVEWLGTMAGIVLAGLVIATMLVGIGFAVASFINRRAFVSVTLVLLFLGGPIVAEVLTANDLSQYWRLVDAPGVAIEFAPRLWGDSSESFAEVGNAVVFLGQAAWLVIPWVVYGYRYQKMEAL